jgi:hypothetical protein
VSQDINAVQLRPGSEHPHSSNAHAVTGATRFEANDARASMVIWSLVIIAGMLVGVFALTVWIQRFLYEENPVGELPSPLAPERILPPNPQIEVHPWEYLPILRAQEDHVLNSYGKDASGHLRIPINRAMDAVIPGLKIRPDAPAGITTPGGDGRYSPGVEDAHRTPYRIEIRGGVQENAQ